MSVYKQRRFVCLSCAYTAAGLCWDYDPPPVCPQHGPMEEDRGASGRAPGVVDDTIIGGRWCETLGHEPVWIESQSQLRREAEQRGLVNVVRKTEDYYARQRRLHDQELRDIGYNREY